MVDAEYLPLYRLCPRSILAYLHPIVAQGEEPQRLPIPKPTRKLVTERPVLFTIFSQARASSCSSFPQGIRISTALLGRAPYTQGLLAP
jgi:hypothetical protein